MLIYFINGNRERGQQHKNPQHSPYNLCFGCYRYSLTLHIYLFIYLLLYVFMFLCLCFVCMCMCVSCFSFTSKTYNNQQTSLCLCSSRVQYIYVSLCECMCMCWFLLEPDFLVNIDDDNDNTLNPIWKLEMRRSAQSQSRCAFVLLRVWNQNDAVLPPFCFHISFKQ